jgi:tRNA threonylcarbamoyladenosine biosynthesis protein TsaB
VLLLSLDTATPAVSVALVADGRLVARSSVIDARRHAELVTPGIAAVLAAGQARAADLDAVAVGLGPGPYTGLRVGIVTAAALADALDIPAYGECSLDLVADDDPGQTAVVTDARRREVYWATYCGSDGTGVRRRVDGPQVGRPAAVATELRDAGARVVGAGAALYPDDFADLLDPGGRRYPAPERLWDLVAERALAGAAGDQLRPLYLRRPDAVEPGVGKTGVGKTGVGKTGVGKLVTPR